MKTVKDIIISISEPLVNNVAWLQSQSNNTYKLFIYSNSGWVPILDNGGGDGNIYIEFIKEIHNIIINN